MSSHNKMTLAHFSFSLSAWRAHLFAVLLLGAISGCYVPAPYYDFSNLSDNVVDASIKKHFLPHSRNIGEPRIEDDLREDFLAAFPAGSSSEAAVSYLISIGGRCRVESQEKEHQTDRCEYEKIWKQYLKHPLSKEFIGDMTGVIDYVIESSRGKIKDVVVEFKMKNIHRAVR